MRKQEKRGVKECDCNRKTAHEERVERNGQKQRQKKNKERLQSKKDIKRKRHKHTNTATKMSLCLHPGLKISGWSCNVQPSSPSD